MAVSSSPVAVAVAALHFDGERAHFVAWVVWLAGGVGRDASWGSPVADAVAVIVRAAEAAAGVVGLDCWQFAAAATGGRLLGNTTAPFPAPWTPTTLADR